MSSFGGEEWGFVELYDVDRKAQLFGSVRMGQENPRNTNSELQLASGFLLELTLAHWLFPKFDPPAIRSISVLPRLSSDISHQAPGSLEDRVVRSLHALFHPGHRLLSKGLESALRGLQMVWQ